MPSFHQRSVSIFSILAWAQSPQENLLVERGEQLKPLQGEVEGTLLDRLKWQPPKTPEVAMGFFTGLRTARFLCLGEETIKCIAGHENRALRPMPREEGQGTAMDEPGRI